nr:hypothetical protein [Tanacetum cinerariifolium]
MIFDGMIRHLDAKKKFLMYPRLLQVFLNNQLLNISVPLEHLPTPILTKKVFSFMIRQGLNFSGKITPLFPLLLTQAAVAEGEDLGTHTESQPTPSPTQRGYTSDGDEGSLNMEALYALCTNLSNRVLALETVKDTQAKEILKLKAKIKKLERSDKLDAELDEEMKYMDTKEDLNKRRQSTVSTARPDDDTARPDVSTARQELSIDGPTTTPTTSTIFDDEEINLENTLIKLKDDKAKGVAFKDSKSTDRPARSILTLKPLPTINPKDKRKGVLEEPESAKKMTKSDFDAAQIAKDEEIARLGKKQLAEERVAAIRNKPPTKTQLRRLMMTYLINIDFVPIGSKEDERMIRDLNKKAKEESSDKERRYPLTTRTLKRMMSIRLIAESASDAAYDLLRFIQKQINESGGHDRGEKDL